MPNAVPGFFDLERLNRENLYCQPNSISRDKEDLILQQSNRSFVKGCGPIKATRNMDLSIVERLKDAGILPPSESKK